ncbi:unnamed protein product [Gordionus sp. m RMFG-2023]
MTDAKTSKIELDAPKHKSISYTKLDPIKSHFKLTSDSYVKPINNNKIRHIWIILLACFINFFIVDGIGHSLSLFFVTFGDNFPDSKSKISWIISIHYSMTLLSGPLAGLVLNYFGCGKANMIGGFLAFLGFFVSSFTNQIWVLMLFMGCLSGLGVAIIYVSSYTIILFYFTNKKELATGIFSCGSGIGALIFGPFVQYLIKQFAWQGSLLILSAIFLQTLVCGCLIILYDTIFDTNLLYTEPTPAHITNSNRDNSDTNDKEIESPMINLQSSTNKSKSLSHLSDSNLNDANQDFYKSLPLIAISAVNFAQSKSDHDNYYSQSNRNTITSGETTFDGKIIKFFRTRLKYFKNLNFLIFFISNLLLYASGDTPCLFTIDRTVNLKIAKDTGLLISVMGVSNTIGHIFYGILSHYVTNIHGSKASSHSLIVCM